MKFIDAKWDTRSLGLPCAELIFEHDDTVLNVYEAVQLCNQYSYIVAKIPPGRVDLSLSLQGKGFTHIETSIELSINIFDIKVPRIIARIEPRVRSCVADSDGINRIINRIKSGVFDTDRIYLDPEFPDSLAAIRYANWILDELKQGATLHHVLYQGEEAGFFAYKERYPGVEAYPFLSGVYNEWKDKGLGANIACLEPLREAQRRKCRRIRTYVSSNNIAMLRIHEAMGYHVTNLTDVLIKHNNNTEYAID